MENIVKDQKQMINYLHKQAEDHVKNKEMLTEMNEELEKEISDKDQENGRIKKELKLKSEKLKVYEEEFGRMENKKDHLDKLIKTLQTEKEESCRKVKEIEDDQHYSDLIQKIDKDNLEKDLSVKSEECSEKGIEKRRPI